MARIKRLVRPEPAQLNWKLALPILGLAACAAFYSHTASAQPASQHTAMDGARRINGPASENAYALVRDTGHGANMNGDSADWKEIDAARRKLQGDFLWFRDGGKTWVVQDQDILARANAAWAPVDTLGEQMDAYGRQMDEHGKAMEALGRDMERASARFDAQLRDDRTMRDVERQMNELGRQMARLGERMNSADGAQRENLESQMRRLGLQMQALGERIGAQQESAARKQAQGSMDELGRKMQQASLPMGELGKQMGALGKQIEKESKVADKAVRKLIREAREKGLARPAPGSA